MTVVIPSTVHERVINRLIMVDLVYEEYMLCDFCMLYYANERGGLSFAVTEANVSSCYCYVV